MTPRLTPEDKQLILRRYQEGTPLRQIGREIGRPDITVRRTLESLGVVFGPPKTTNRRSSPETEAAVLRLYDQNLTWAEISAQTGVTSVTINKILKRNGRETDRKPESTENQIELITALYESGHSTRKIGSMLNHSKSTINRIVAENGMEIRHGLDCENQDFFDVIDTEEKAYWLGFITADGCVVSTPRHPEGERISVQLAIRDRKHLVKLKQALAADAKIVTRVHKEGFDGRVKDRGFASFSVGSQKLVSALANLGVGPRKSATVEPWNGPDDLIRHYWRGVVDGDGSIARKSDNLYTVFLCGSEACVRGFAEWASRVCGTKATPYFRTGCWYVGVSGRHQVPKLIQALYGDCSVSLDRKQERADQILTPSED